MSANSETPKTVKVIESKKFAPMFVKTIETMLSEDIPNMDDKKENYLAENAAKFFLSSYEDGWDVRAIQLEKGIPLVSMGLCKTPKTAPDTMREIPFTVLKETAENILLVYSAMRSVRASLIKPTESTPSEKLVMPE